MTEVIVAVVGGAVLITNTYLARKVNKDLATQNGHKPGFMIEATYELVKQHIDDEGIHRRE